MYQYVDNYNVYVKLVHLSSICNLWGTAAAVLCQCAEPGGGLPLRHTDCSPEGAEGYADGG